MPDPKRSAAAKRAAETRRRQAEEQAERDRFKIWLDRFKDIAIFVGGLMLGFNEFVLEKEPREQAVIVMLAALSLPFAAAAGRKLS